jgi:hypothetical protein
MIQARVCRSRRRASSTPDSAIALGEAIPFLEHDLHEQVSCCAGRLGFVLSSTHVGL